MKYAKIDLETGLFITDETFDYTPKILDENGNVIDDPQYVSESCTGQFKWPKWNGTEWVEGHE